MKNIKLLFVLLLSIVTAISCSKDDSSSISGTKWQADWSEVIDDVTLYTTGVITFGSVTATFTFYNEEYSNGNLVYSNEQSHSRTYTDIDYPTVLIIDGNGDISTIVISNNSFTLWNQTYYKK